MKDYTSCTSVPNTLIEPNEKVNNIVINNNKFLKRFRRTVGVPSPSKILNNEQILNISKNLFKKAGPNFSKTKKAENEKIKLKQDESYTSVNIINGVNSPLYSQKIITKNITSGRRRRPKLDFMKKSKPKLKVRKISISHRSRQKRNQLKYQTKTFTPLEIRNK
jgi:hypothetical protein